MDYQYSGNSGNFDYYYYDYETSNVHLYGYYDALMIIIPLVAGVCVSLPALIWTLYVVYTLYKQVRRISTFIIFLTINDLVELLSSAVIASYLIDRLVNARATNSLKFTDENYIRLYWFIHLFITFRISGLYLHQLVAIQSMLSLKKQLCSTNVFSPLGSTITCVILWLLAFGCQFFNIWLNLTFSFLPCCILAITCILTSKAFVTPDHIKPSLAVLIVSTLTLITFSATVGVVVLFIKTTGEFNNNISAFLISLRVITDPLLCALVSKEQLRVHKQQMHIH